MSKFQIDLKLFSHIIGLFTLIIFIIIYYSNLRFVSHHIENVENHRCVLQRDYRF